MSLNKSWKITNLNRLRGRHIINFQKCKIAHLQTIQKCKLSKDSPPTNQWKQPWESSTLRRSSRNPVELKNRERMTAQKSLGSTCRHHSSPQSRAAWCQEGSPWRDFTPQIKDSRRTLVGPLINSQRMTERKNNNQKAINKMSIVCPLLSITKLL